VAVAVVVILLVGTIWEVVAGTSSHSDAATTSANASAGNHRTGASKAHAGRGHQPIPVFVLTSPASSSGEATESTPRVVGDTVRAATNALNAAHLLVRVVTTTDGSSAAGTVLSQQPRAGSHTAVGSTVTITVAGGNASNPPTTQVAVPNVVGVELDIAEQTLAKFDLTWHLTTPGPIDSTVATQSPAAGTNVDPGTSVALTTSGGASPSASSSAGS
jgi:beta-lactam-binding protein with PASTA domain